MPQAERERIVSALKKMLQMGIGAVYGEEEEGAPEALVDCAKYLGKCGARCCSFVFALTKEEAKRGRVRHDPGRPYFILRGDDGYCAHLDRIALRCAVWRERPTRCRRYDCRGDSSVWHGGAPLR